MRSHKVLPFWLLLVIRSCEMETTLHTNCRSLSGMKFFLFASFSMLAKTLADWLGPWRYYSTGTFSISTSPTSNASFLHSSCPSLTALSPQHPWCRPQLDANVLMLFKWLFLNSNLPILLHLLFIINGHTFTRMPKIQRIWYYIFSTLNEKGWLWQKFMIHTQLDSHLALNALGDGDDYTMSSSALNDKGWLWQKYWTHIQQWLVKIME